ncbi:uncharacterized protein LOC120413935 isoform X1 [Culex pipiens pallens]|uniref:uncharacterized protein LOC120413935 isoform X1 n=2 Tax=Culex pipiens pallens TaxID=42434 RepID=UPI001953CFCD|nr:uncharacterized protein LOC120413935 isoform X1 [Culex pipiens pallens]
MPNAVNDHPIGKQKLAPRFNRLKVLNIIKLATMDKMKEAEGAGGVGGGGTAGGGGGGTTEGGDAFHSEFYNTGRIGRRNALPDILGSHCTTTTADLPTQLGALSTSDCPTKAPNTQAGSPMVSNTATTSATGGGGGGGS